MNIALVTFVTENLIPFSKKLIESAIKNSSGKNEITYYYVSSKKNIEEIERFVKLDFCEVDIENSFNHGS